MRVRLERYEMANRSTQSRSLLAFIFGGLGLVFFGFIAFMGLLMIAMPDREGGGLWAVRSGILLFFFIGVVPLGICALVITWGVKQRGRFRRLGELAAIARQSPMLTVPQVAHALRLTLADADRLILDAGSLGLIEPGESVALAPTVAQAYGPSPYAATPASEPQRPSGPPISTGAVLGEAYRIEEPLGQGGMGAVYAARHLRTGRRYAVKTILAGASASEDAIRRFEREATAASAIGHPGIVQVHDFNVAPGGLFYLVMDLLEGETLEQRLARSPALPWPEAQRIAVELCAALGAAHAHGLLHRDIKPSNIFLAKGAQATAAERVVLVDFGLVKSIAESSAGLTSTGAVIGTPMYMSPEQARGEGLDVRSDLYSLAAVIFEAVTGAPPFLDRTMASVYARLLNDPPPRASQVSRRALPRAVDDVLVRALAKDRAARYPTARALGEALAAIREEPALTEAPTTERMSG
ncbi:MAG TPA: serine/threonine-protein kinase [Labilithrix sp.]|nr:serine/threonine-protein kinase [Labilithrix sp.]